MTKVPYFYGAHYEHYLKLKKQVEGLIGEAPQELKRYNKRYEAELLKAKSIETTSMQFFKEISKYSVVLVGDFHAQKQAARSFYRIARKIGQQNIVIALECFLEKDQRFIDLFLKSNLTEAEFKKKINWSETWGFAWEPVGYLLKWAKQNGVNVYGINRNQSRIKLKDRDQFIAQKINQLYQKYSLHNSEIKILVQIGDFHLAHDHLPREIRKINSKISLAKVYQSPDIVFFKLLKNKSHYKMNNFYKLDKDSWAIMTVLPWVKWQEYLLFLEKESDPNIYDADVDYTDHVFRYLQLMSHVFNFKNKFEVPDIYFADDPKLKLLFKKLPAARLKTIKLRMSMRESFYVPEIQIGIISRLTFNHFSRLASLIILSQIKIFNQTLDLNSESFLKLIWIEMQAYFMIKSVNPKRKTDTMTDIRSHLNQKKIYQPKGKYLSHDHRNTLLLAIEQKMKEIKFTQSGQLPSLKSKEKYTNKNYSGAAQMLGGILGEKLYLGYVKKRIKEDQFRKFIFIKTDEKNFSIKYYEAVEQIDSWPIDFKSKYEQF